MKLKCQKTSNELITAAFNNSFEFIIKSAKETLYVDLNFEQVKELQKQLENKLKGK